MADLTITAASVIAGSTATIKHEVAGATITAGQQVYRDATASNKCKLADCDSATAGVRDLYGTALHGASDGQPLAVATGGPVTIGATMMAGVAYYLSATPGGICPVADLGAGDYPTIVGIATSTTVLDIAIHASGVAL